MGEAEYFVISKLYHADGSYALEFPEHLPEHIHVTEKALTYPVFYAILSGVGYELDENHIHTNHVGLKGMSLKNV